MSINFDTGTDEPCLTIALPITQIEKFMLEGSGLVTHVSLKLELNCLGGCGNINTDMIGEDL